MDLLVHQLNQSFPIGFFHFKIITGGVVSVEIGHQGLAFLRRDAHMAEAGRRSDLFKKVL